MYLIPDSSRILPKMGNIRLVLIHLEPNAVEFPLWSVRSGSNNSGAGSKTLFALILC